MWIMASIRVSLSKIIGFMLPDEFVVFGQYGWKAPAAAVAEGIAVYLGDSKLPASFPADLPLLESLCQQGTYFRKEIHLVMFF